MTSHEGTAWRKSSHSSPDGSNCVEVACAGEMYAVRDSKDRDAAPLIFSRDQWRAFVTGLKDE